MKLRGAFFILPLYVFRVGLFFNCSSSLSFWIILEINALCFSIVAIRWGDSIISILYYVLIQTFGSFLYLIHSFLDETWTFSFISVAGLLVKMGAVPFQFWVFNMVNAIGWKTFFTLLTLQKIPAAAILFSQESSLVFLVCLFNIVAGSVMLVYMSLLKELFVASSVYINYWNYIIICFFPAGFAFFYALYRVRMYFRINRLTQAKVCSAALVASFLMGLPPFSIFYLKFFFLDLISMFIRRSLLTLVWVAAFLCVVGYFKYFVSKLSSLLHLIRGVARDVKALYAVFTRFTVLTGSF